MIEKSVYWFVKRPPDLPKNSGTAQSEHLPQTTSGTPAINFPPVAPRITSHRSTKRNKTKIRNRANPSENRIQKLSEKLAPSIKIHKTFILPGKHVVHFQWHIAVMNSLASLTGTGCNRLPCPC
ncbi:MAG: hypothetical protein WD075_03775 [Rhodospirillales bacterium]